MRIQRDTWLSEVLARSVFSVHEAASGTVEELGIACAQPGAFYFAKVTATDMQGMDVLSTAGFRVIEANVTLTRSIEPLVPAATSANLHVCPARPEWRDEVLAVAGSAFRFSRFHLDPCIDRAAADRVKREWVRSYFDGQRGNRLLVALESHEPVAFLGFLVTAREDRRVGVIDLIAVRPDRQGRGIGERLVAAAVDECQGTADVLEVGTQTANVPSLRLYEHTGFKVARSGFALHRHVAVE
jgi:dTDP-4-amino-4,6-dideoxy-D-galactose acyltransferase